MKLKAKNTEDQKNDHNMYRDDLRDRVKRLEQLLQQSSEEKDEMRKTILLLTEQVAKLTVKVEYLEGDKPQLTRRTRKTKDEENY